jgi:phosphonate metabolism protein (transferase hexapeptide repeat family)
MPDESRPGPAASQPEKRLSEAPTIHSTSRVYFSEIGAWTEIGPNSQIVESTFGEYSYVASEFEIIYSDVGKFCSIASHVCINPGNHPMWRVTQRHLTYRRVQYGFDAVDDGAFFDWRRAARCVVAHGATIVAGIEVRTGAVVGAGAVVTHDVAPYTIVAGVPARPIRRRFPDDVIQKL